ncbi:hypothetical protein C7271_15340, partial [filamentous cyanobacterium CCP5]
FYDYAFVTRGAEHNVRQNFLRRLGDPAATSLKSTGLSTVDSNSDVGDDYKQKLKEKLNQIAYDVNINPYGRFDLPTERIPDHSRFKPINITETADGIRYHTEAGQTFDIRINQGELTHTVEGLGLQMMSGRGVTQDSPWFTKNQGFNRAHLIANEFGGSGYADGQNLATTSDHYNKNVMRDAERTIGQSIELFAEANGVEVDHVRFDMTVQVTFGNLLDSQILAKIAQQDWFPKESAEALENDIKQKIEAGDVSEDLMRVTGVVYTWRARIPAGVVQTLPQGKADRQRTTRIGPDYWILAAE